MPARLHRQRRRRHLRCLGVPERRQAAAFAAIEERVRANTAEVLQRSRNDGVTLRQAATAFAEQRVREAMATRRWSLF